MKKLTLFLLFFGTLTHTTVDAQDRRLIVYSDVPGLKKSDQFALAVRPVEGAGAWRKAFPFITRCKKGVDGSNSYFSHLSGWSNTYINFEMNQPVEVAIARADGRPIRTAVAHPQHKVSSCKVVNGRAFVTIKEPCQIAVDIDGQMDNQDTGKGYQGPPSTR